MAWITKNSGGAKVELRDKPYLTPAMRDDLTKRYLPRYERAHAALLPALHLVQHEYGWIPHQAMMEIAEFLKLTPADVRRILTASARRLSPGERDDNFGSGLIDPLKALQLADPRTATTVPPSLAPPMRIIRQR